MKTKKCLTCGVEFVPKHNTYRYCALHAPPTANASAEKEIDPIIEKIIGLWDLGIPLHEIVAQTAVSPGYACREVLKHISPSTNWELAEAQFKVHKLQGTNYFKRD